MIAWFCEGVVKGGYGGSEVRRAMAPMVCQHCLCKDERMRLAAELGTEGVIWGQL